MYEGLSFILLLLLIRFRLVVAAEEHLLNPSEDAFVGARINLAVDGDDGFNIDHLLSVVDSSLRIGDDESDWLGKDRSV